MTPEEMRRHGTALAERVRSQVDTEERLRLTLGHRRRRRRMEFALATAAVVIAVLVGVTMFSGADEPPVGTEPQPTTPTTTQITGLRPLPVEIFLVLVNDYTVDAATGECSGSRALSGVEEGFKISIVESSGEAQAAAPGGSESPTLPEVASMVLPAGTEIVRDAAPPYLLPTGRDAGCAFTLGNPGIEISDFDLVLPGYDLATSGTISGQRHVIVIGE